MKYEVQDKQEFKPVTVTFETEEELALFAAIMGTTGSSLRADMLKQAGVNGTRADQAAWEFTHTYRKIRDAEHPLVNELCRAFLTPAALEELRIS